MQKKRDILDYITIISGLAVTAFTIYFLVEKLRQQKLEQKRTIDKPDQPKIGVIIQ
jgi:hypothetical protein